MTCHRSRSERLGRARATGLFPSTPASLDLSIRLILRGTTGRVGRRRIPRRVSLGHGDRSRGRTVAASVRGPIRPIVLRSDPTCDLSRSCSLCLPPRPMIADGDDALSRHGRGGCRVTVLSDGAGRAGNSFFRRHEPSGLSGPGAGFPDRIRDKPLVIGTSSDQTTKIDGGTNVGSIHLNTWRIGIGRREAGVDVTLPAWPARCVTALHGTAGYHRKLMRRLNRPSPCRIFNKR
jgi:hypothetical protein